uniref:Envelope-like protein n=1 Tax=Angiostrongylus cantonensis TaxID=6313 RepID=A0A0K0D6V2_ANGCA
LESHRDASVDDLHEHKKDLESKVQPIISKLYKEAGDGADGASAGDKDEL